MAKRLEWENVAPEGMKIVCEYALHGQPPPFGGFFGSTPRTSRT